MFCRDTGTGQLSKLSVKVQQTNPADEGEVTDSRECMALRTRLGMCYICDCIATLIISFGLVFEIHFANISITVRDPDHLTRTQRMGSNILARYRPRTFFHQVVETVCIVTVRENDPPKIL
jgi:hypothetical protein